MRIECSDGVKQRRLYANMYRSTDCDNAVMILRAGFFINRHESTGRRDLRARKSGISVQNGSQAV